METLLKIIGYTAGTGLAAHFIQTLVEPERRRDMNIKDSIKNWKSYLGKDGLAAAATALTLASYNIPYYIKCLR